MKRDRATGGPVDSQCPVCRAPVEWAHLQIEEAKTWDVGTEMGLAPGLITTTDTDRVTGWILDPCGCLVSKVSFVIEGSQFGPDRRVVWTIEK